MTLLTIQPSSLNGSELYLDAGLPGFPGARRFRVMAWGETTGPFSLMVCLDVEDLAFVVVPPEVFFPDYTPEIGRATAERLRIADASDAAVYVIVTLGPSPADATVNLLGPIVVNRRTLRAAQVVQEGNHWDVRTPLVRRLGDAG